MRTCVICGKPLPNGTNYTRKTCSDVCSKVLRSRMSSGRRIVWKQSARSKVSKRRATDPELLANVAAMRKRLSELPQGQPGESHHSAKEWRLISPEGRVYDVKSLTAWAKENSHMFGLPPSAYACIVSGFGAIVSSMRGRSKRRHFTYKGWRLASEPSQIHPVKSRARKSECE